MNRWCVAALAAVLVFPVAAAAQDKAAGKPAPISCSLVSYDAARNVVTVQVDGVPAKRGVFAAAMLNKGQEGGIWVQAGKDVKADGPVELEAYDFAGGMASVLVAKNPAGKQFLIAAQKGAAKGKPINADKLKRAAVTTVCSFEVQ